MAKLELALGGVWLAAVAVVAGGGDRGPAQESAPPPVVVAQAADPAPTPRPQSGERGQRGEDPGKSRGFRPGIDQRPPDDPPPPAPPVPPGSDEIPPGEPGFRPGIDERPPEDPLAPPGSKDVPSPIVPPEDRPHVTIEGDSDRAGGDFDVVDLPAADAEACALACARDGRCRAFTLVPVEPPGAGGRCWLKSEISARRPHPGRTSGVRLVRLRGFRCDGSGASVVPFDAFGPLYCEARCAEDTSCRSFMFRPTTPGAEPGSCVLYGNVCTLAVESGTLSGYKPDSETLRDYRQQPVGGPVPPPAPVNANSGAGLARSAQPLFARRGAIWESHAIPVCWESMDPARASERAWVQAKIAATWSAAADVTFTGWGQCADGAGGIRIGSTDGVANVEVLGSGLDGVEDGMELSFDRPCGLARQACIEQSATHEFGHALGFSHEQNRDDAPAWCRDKAQGTDGDVYVTPFDIASVMNYCNPLKDNGGVLSAGDRAGVQFWYGPSQSSGVPWTPDCRYDAVLFQEPRFGGRQLRVYGSLQELHVEDFGDRASALCVPAGYRLVAYEHAQFAGQTWSIDGPSLFLSLGSAATGQPFDWDDKISSVRLVDLRSGSTVYDAQHECDTDVLLFQETHFRGESLVVKGTIADLDTVDFNDRATSICVPRDRTLRLWQHSGFRGKHLDLVGPRFVQDLDGEDFDDSAGSVELE